MMTRNLWRRGLCAAAAGVSTLGVIGTTALSTAESASASTTTRCSSLFICTVTFTTSGAGQTWKVPLNDNGGFVTIALYGAVGGSEQHINHPAGGIGGDGAEVTGTLAVTPGETVTVDVGGAGSPEYYAGKNGGGIGYVSGGGGGMTDIRVNGELALVAGGGGGGGAPGFSSLCANETDAGGAGGNAGSAGQAGSGYTASDLSIGGGQGGAAGSSGGAGGAAGRAPEGSTTCNGATYTFSNDNPGGTGTAGHNGAAGVGGAGGESYGGGGGGGYVGGGGGGGEVEQFCLRGACTPGQPLNWSAGGGGGGGSSAGPGVSSYKLVSNTANAPAAPVGDAAGDGMAVISWRRGVIPRGTPQLLTELLALLAHLAPAPPTAS